MSLSKVPMPESKKDTRPLEERLKDVKTITLGAPTEPGYVYGDYSGKALTKEEAENAVYNQIMKDRPTHISDIKYDAKPRPDNMILHTVTARGYMPDPKKSKTNSGDGFGATGGIVGVGN